MPGMSEPFDDYGDDNLNQTVHTVMSYNRGFARQDPVGAYYAEVGYAAGPSPLDIAAIQFLYGARTDVN